MPANKKYLSTPWQQFAKLTAGLIGGYIISALLCMCLALWLPNPKKVLITSIYLLFIFWTCFLIIPYLFKNGWVSWLVYLIIITVLYIGYYLGIQQNPFA